MPNDDYIKRSDAKKILSLLPADLDAETMQRCIEAMSRVQAADVEKVTHGRWIEYEHEGQMAQYCSECGSDPGVIYIYRRCPECGAKMMGEEDDDRVSLYG